jgi:hypothetical protein
MARSHKRRIHWLVPFTLLTSFAAGLCLAIAHHFFYSYLNESDVSDSIQQYNTAIGTAFSFLVRAALVISITTAYWQLFWRTLHQDLPISTIDSLASILGALQEFLAASTLRASPSLVAVALLSWLIPVAVIFPPATLTVVSQSHTHNERIFLNAPDFLNTEAFARTKTQYVSMDMPNSMPSYTAARWDGPTSQLKRVMMGTAFQGELPIYTPPSPNSSYTLFFHGPAVQCQRIDDPAVVLGNLSAATACGNYYLSWTPMAWVPRDSDSDRVLFDSTDIMTPVFDSPTLGMDDYSLPEIYIALRGSLQSSD